MNIGCSWVLSLGLNLDQALRKARCKEDLSREKDLRRQPGTAKDFFKANLSNKHKHVLTAAPPTSDVACKLSRLISRDLYRTANDHQLL